MSEGEGAQESASAQTETTGAVEQSEQAEFTATRLGEGLEALETDQQDDQPAKFGDFGNDADKLWAAYQEQSEKAAKAQKSYDEINKVMHKRADFISPEVLLERAKALQTKEASKEFANLKHDAFLEKAKEMGLYEDPFSNWDALPSKLEKYGLEPVDTSTPEGKAVMDQFQARIAEAEFTEKQFDVGVGLLVDLARQLADEEVARVGRKFSREDMEHSLNKLSADLGTAEARKLVKEVDAGMGMFPQDLLTKPLTETDVGYKLLHKLLQGIKGQSAKVSNAPSQLPYRTITEVSKRMQELYKSNMLDRDPAANKEYLELAALSAKLKGRHAD